VANGDQIPERQDQAATGLRRFQLATLMDRHNARMVLGTYMFVNAGLAIGVMASLAMATHQPFVFPSLGPTAFLVFYQPLAPNAAPRSAFFGHLIGVVAGYLGLVIFGLTQTLPNLEAINLPRVGAMAFALAATLSLMVWLGVPHAPAGATTLIVATGLMRTPEQLAILMTAVVVLLVQAFVINRLAGVPYPVWAPCEDPSMNDRGQQSQPTVTR
jgi:CBS domain-containing membrane protein